MEQLQLIQSKIYEIRGQKVMLDFDLAEMYGTETKYLKRSVKNNIRRFPAPDFMFELTKDLFMLAISTGVGYILSVAYIFFADVKWLYSVFLTLWMYLSALFYPVSKLPEAMQNFIGYNPIYIVIAFARECVMEGRVPDMMMWIRLIGWSVGSLAVGYYFFRSKGNQVMQKI